MQDDILIRRAAAKDESAFEQLMLLHQKPVYNICYRMAGNADDALDLSQEVFLKLWRTLEQYQFDAAFSTWLFRLTRPAKWWLPQGPTPSGSHQTRALGPMWKKGYS